MDCHTVQSSNIDGILSIAIESKVCHGGALFNGQNQFKNLATYEILRPSQFIWPLFDLTQSLRNKGRRLNFVSTGSKTVAVGTIREALQRTTYTRLGGSSVVVTLLAFHRLVHVQNAHSGKLTSEPETYVIAPRNPFFLVINEVLEYNSHLGNYYRGLQYLHTMSSS
ncbi:hypothetical protein H5410_043734 [Solanum commersonii]|uniref:Uncharacterized protein n=1 Tax=Solanum commersonii TaxID=4109 RepID=A0A9J5Y1L6_SOLCO|nr:hypothetical protein H5410_043734 [Solanum commersonii]